MMSRERVFRVCGTQYTCNYIFHRYRDFFIFIFKFSNDEAYSWTRCKRLTDALCVMHYYNQRIGCDVDFALFFYLCQSLLVREYQ